MALIQAANYIYENHTTTQTYLERYESDKRLFLEQSLVRREYHGGSIDITLRLSLKALESCKPEAAAFLLFCGYLDNKDIFWKFLNVGYRFAGPNPCEEGARLSGHNPSSVPFQELGPGWLDEIARDEATYDAVVKYLHELSFIRWNEESDGFSIHPVIHDWIISYGHPQTKSKLLTLAANVVAANFGAQSDIPSQRIQPHADRCIGLGSTNQGFRTWSFSSLYLLGAFYFDNQDLTLAQQLIGLALNQLISAFGDDSEMTALWCMRVSPMFIHCSPIDTHIQQLLRAQVKLTSHSQVSHRRRQFGVDQLSQNWVDINNHLCYAYQVQGDFKKAMEIGEAVIEFIASGRVDLIYTCCAIGLLAESYLINGRYESAKSYAMTAIGQHEQIFGPDSNDSSLSAWRRRNMTTMAIACAFLGEYELAEVILVSVHVEAMRYYGPDADLSMHAQHNLDCLRADRAREEQPSATPFHGASSSGEEKSRDQTRASKGKLHELSTDRDVTYLRFDLAMGVYETLGVVDWQIRTRAGAQTSASLGQSSHQNATPLMAQLTAAACIIQ